MINQEIISPPYSNRIEMDYTLKYIKLWKDLMKIRNYRPPYHGLQCQNI